MRMKFVALSVATLLFVVGWFFVGFRPAGSKLTEVKDNIETTRTEIAALEARLARLQELKSNAKELRAEEARLAKGLPNEPAVSTFIRQVQDAANEAGIDFLSVAPSTPSADTPAAPAAGEAGAVQPAAMRTISVSLNANGGFFSIEEFVSKMERLDRAIKIDTFNLSGSGDELSLAINLKMFMGQAAAVPAPAPATTQES